MGKEISLKINDRCPEVNSCEKQLIETKRKQKIVFMRGNTGGTGIGSI
jgi:hypothetical protein